MEACMQAAIQEGQEIKDPNIIYIRIQQMYQRFNEGEREIAEEVINQWLVFGDEDHWSMAVSLANTFNLHGVLPNLRILLGRLRRESGPLSPFNVAKVERLISKLDA